MKKRPAGVKVLAAFYLLSGALGLLLALLGLFAWNDTAVSTAIWGTGGALLALFSLVLSWGLWGLNNWARLLAMVFNAFATLGQSGLGLLLITKTGADLVGTRVAGDLAQIMGFLLLIFAAINVLVTWYLARQPVREIFQGADLDPTLVVPMTTRKLSTHQTLPTVSADAAVAASMDIVPPAGAWLVARTGPQVGQIFLLNRERNTIGRDPTRATIKVDDPLISRQHAQFNIDQGRVLVYDLASTNGTFVNNRRVQMQTLNDGDVVRVGQTEFVFKQRE